MSRFVAAAAGLAFALASGFVTTTSLVGCECKDGGGYLFHVTVVDADTGLPVKGVGLTDSLLSEASCEAKLPGGCATWTIDSGGEQGETITVAAQGYIAQSFAATDDAPEPDCGPLDVDKTIHLVHDP